MNRLIVGIILSAAVACDTTDALLEKGALNLTLGDYRRARACFETAVDKRPASAAARLGLGKALLQQAAAQPRDSALIIDCLTQFEAARTLKPDHEIETLSSAAWFRRANGLLTAGDTLACLQALSRSISLNPLSISPLNLAGILYFHRGEREKALNLFKKATAIDSSSVSGHFNAGLVYWTDSNYTAAYDCFFKAARHSPGDREILLWAARAKQAALHGAR
jgi:tetratricopeptide (TPR) repeat protein